jgi:hypothetical protein
MENGVNEIFVMRGRKGAAGLFWLLLVLSIHISCRAGTTEEIAALLLFVEQSECTFIRNGTQYNGSEARGHIETKYDYYKEKISTTEDFITYAATKSVMSGKPYRVLCSGKEMNLADWLQAELAKLRTR